MAKKPDGFFLHPDHVTVAARLLSDEERGRLLLAVSDYFATGKLPESEAPAFMACFDLMKSSIDRQMERYQAACERNRQNILKRWGEPDSAILYDGIRPNTGEYDRIPDLPVDTTSTNKIKSNKKKERECTRKRFTPPSLEEVRDYCESRGSPVDPERFVSYYESVGWRVGKQSMKSWKAAIGTWERREAQETPPQSEKVSPYARYESN